MAAFCSVEDLLRYDSFSKSRSRHSTDSLLRQFENGTHWRGANDSHDIHVPADSSEASGQNLSPSSGDGKPIQDDFANERMLNELVGLFKLLADDTRVRILYFLQQSDELNVRELCKLLNNVSLRSAITWPCCARRG